MKLDTIKQLMSMHLEAYQKLFEASVLIQGNRISPFKNDNVKLNNLSNNYDRIKNEIKCLEKK